MGIRTGGVCQGVLGAATAGQCYRRKGGKGQHVVRRTNNKKKATTTTTSALHSILLWPLQMLHEIFPWTLWKIAFSQAVRTWKIFINIFIVFLAKALFMGCSPLYCDSVLPMPRTVFLPHSRLRNNHKRFTNNSEDTEKEITKFTTIKNTKECTMMWLMDLRLYSIVILVQSFFQIRRSVCVFSSLFLLLCIPLSVSLCLLFIFKIISINISNSRTVSLSILLSLAPSLHLHLH